MSSLYPSSYGIYFLNPDLEQSSVAKNNTLLPKRFQDEGYYVTGAGKLFHGNQNQKYLPNYAGSFGGFGPLPKKKVSSYPGMKLWDWGAYPENDTDMPDHKIAAWGIEQLNQRFDQPLFLATGFYRPHVPQFAPQKWFDLYPLDSLQLPVSVSNDLDDISEYGKQITRLGHVAPTMQWVLENEQWKPLVQSYLACVSFVDHQIGKLLDALDSSPYKENTYVVLYTDHGFIWVKRSVLLNEVSGKTHSNTHDYSRPWNRERWYLFATDSIVGYLSNIVELTGLNADSQLEGSSLVPS